MALFRGMSHNRGTAWILCGLGNVALARSDYPQAHAYYEESLALQRTIGDKQGIALALYHLGLTARGRETTRRPAPTIPKAWHSFESSITPRYCAHS